MGVVGEATITVEQVVTDWSMPISDTLFALNDTIRLIDARDANGYPVLPSDFDGQWSVLDDSVVTADATGLVTAVGNGRTVVSATVREETKQTDVLVRQQVVRIDLSFKADTIFVGDLAEMHTAPLDANGNLVWYWGYGPGGRYRATVRSHISSSDLEILWVNPDRDYSRHRMTGMAEGTATVVVTMVENPHNWFGAGVTASADITVTRRPIVAQYPIHVNFLGDTPAYVRAAVLDATNTWGRILAPTPTSSFVFDRVWRSGTCNGDSTIEFGIGDTLEPGLHLYVVSGTRDGAVGWACGGYGIRSHGTSEVSMDPVALIGLHSEHFDGNQSGIRVIALHEIGHILGVGRGERWWDHTECPDTTEAFCYFTDPVAIAAFDRMGGVDFPTKKIPLHTRSPIHWGICMGLRDVMIPGGGGGAITEVTAASLAYGYRYDREQVVPATLDSERWNNPQYSCKDGQLPRAAPAEINLLNDVIVAPDTLRKNIP